MDRNWTYESANVTGNLHDTVRYLNEYLTPKMNKDNREFDVVTTDYSHMNTVLVFRWRAKE